MGQKIYTNYWINRRDNVVKEHGSYASEEEALKGIKAWWELQKDNYKEVEERRTNSGALEITYGDNNYYYRIIQRESDETLPSLKVKLRSKGEIESLRKKHLLEDEQLLFDELAEPYRDRLVQAMGDGKKVQEYIYDEQGRMIRPLRANRA
ncbi:hypothetical protein [Facklamia miroungae]|uniref:Uncharacterized protein n=1 Tax=Facklamia miroungae TaxID=120956 RepID=A0A1G7P9N1_9LACT|nr:hypothetical protein [Facklamia miroungae]NKZ28630.1 hypothetical protein [Facklamia miroungae]SDF82921.1 hypothetical protein SAMN05421791_101171 [Facklamia miroungae]